MHPVIEATDKDLRFITYKYEFVIAKFVAEDCLVCKALAPAYMHFAEAPEYKDIAFLRIDASENPVSSKEVTISGTPFIVTYKKGTMQECRLVATEAEMKAVLDKLLTH